MRTTSTLVVAIIVLDSLAPAFGPTAKAAGPETTRELETLVRRADFDAAEATAQQLLRSGTLARQDVARVYLQLGVVASAKREAANAEAAFQKALRLDGDVRLPSSVGPHVAQAFARAKASVPPATSTRPAVVLTAASATGDLSVEAPARSDDGDPARRVAVRIGDVFEARDLGEAPFRFSLVLPKAVAVCATATASVLDEFGNELWPAIASAEVCRPRPSVPLSTRGNLDSAPAAASPMATGPTADVLSSRRLPPPAKPISRATWVASALTGAAAVATTVLGLEALERRDDYNASFGNDSKLNQMRGLRDAALTAEHRATAGAIVTALLATATVALYITGRF